MKLPFDMASDAIYFVPLGGCGGFGMNMSLYGYKGEWIMVDCGSGFADDSMPGVDILLPDPEFAVSLKDDLLGIVITHGHEDHIGAIKYLWPRLKKPIYATKFSKERISQAVSEQTWGNQTRLVEVARQGNIQLGPFRIEYIPVAHSIPEANMLSITVDAVGTILHTGDWKIDPTPGEGDITDEKVLRRLGAAEILAAVCDSTNALIPGRSGSEHEVGKTLESLFKDLKGKVAISCFSTNVARIRSIYMAAKGSGRHVCLVGRSMWRTDEAARKCGYLKGVPPFIEADDAGGIPDRKIVYVCTGSQGEARAALARIAADDHPRVGLSPGDTVIFSSRAIPGNERAIDRVKNRFHLSGVDVIDDRDAPVHVSGHPYQDELQDFYRWVQPKIAIPVHGERMMQEKHADIAHKEGVGQAVIPANGQVIEIAKEGIASYVGAAPHGVLALEGIKLVPMDHDAIVTRRRMMFHGSVVVTIVLNKQGELLSDPKITALGLVDENCDLDTAEIEGLSSRIKTALQDVPKARKADDAEMSELARLTARRFFTERYDRKPQTRVHLVRI